MKFSIGDPVYIKSNDEEGVIEEFIGKDMASVVVNARNYHVFLSDIEHPYLRWFLQKGKDKKKKASFVEQISTEKPKAKSAILPTGVYLVFMPIFKIDGFEDIVEKVKVFLYNETAANYYFDYSNIIQKQVQFSIESELLKDQQFYLHDIDFELMASSPVFTYHFVDKQNKELDNENMLVIKPKKLFERIDEIKYANHAIFHFLLFEKLMAREKKEVNLPIPPVQKEKQNTSNHFDFEKALRKTTYEVDLHIEKLLTDYKQLSNSEILHIQLKECQKALDLAVATHQKSLILIHGIGKGVLKNEINNLLNQTSGIKKYVNEFDIRYGYGATKVFFRD